MTDTGTILDAILTHLDRLRDRAAHLDAIGLASAARWLRKAADELEEAATTTHGV